MSAREALYAVVESAYCTPKASPTVGTDAFYFNLPDSDSFAGLMTPVLQEVPYGGGYDVLLDVAADHYTTEVQAKGLGYPTLTKFMLQLGLQQINTGQTSPWTTTEPAGDLASASFYKLTTPRGVAAVRKRYAGCKVASLQLDCSREDPKLRWQATLSAAREVGNAIDASSDPDATEFPAPTDAQIPTGPYLFSHSATNLSVGGSAVTNYASVSLKVTNKLDVLTFEGHFPTVAACHGRKIEVTFQRLLGTTPNYRTTFQGLTDKATYLKFDNGTSSFKVDLGAKCHVSAYTQQLGLGKEFLETITLTGRYSASAGTDCALTFTP